MNWKNWINKALWGVASVVAAAGAIVALPAAGIALPVAVVAIATKVVIFGTTVGVIAAKVLPGHGDNAPPPAGSVVVSKEAVATQIKP